mmetsp:Transcript_29013/g.95975  ORF Transcript_29013/g.95975 Transcript_29013/m.95975 type:complete len:201 (+) Transcript_29013:445-1047(+)
MASQSMAKRFSVRKSAPGGDAIASRFEWATRSPVAAQSTSTSSPAKYASSAASTVGRSRPRWSSRNLTGSPDRGGRVPSLRSSTVTVVPPQSSSRAARAEPWKPRSQRTLRHSDTSCCSSASAPDQPNAATRSRVDAARASPSTRRAKRRWSSPVIFRSALGAAGGDASSPDASSDSSGRHLRIASRTGSMKRSWRSALR